jgi:DHA1 family bicyclomycin/chloramphenicol resistance-like MFS transporter
MSLMHGPLSDAFGRRLVILSALSAFGLAALGCALSPSVGWLTAFRVMQGMSAGVGTVVGRAIICDCFEGAAATRWLALVSMIFSLSPALAPIFSGWVVTLFTWRAIFLTLFAYAVAMLKLCARSLPETLPRHARRPFGLGILAQQYLVAFGNHCFSLVALAIALSFAGLFLYVASVSAFLGHELGLPPTQYATMFVPVCMPIPGLSKRRWCPHVGFGARYCSSNQFTRVYDCKTGVGSCVYRRFPCCSHWRLGLSVLRDDLTAYANRQDDRSMKRQQQGSRSRFPHSTLAAI